MSKALISHILAETLNLPQQKSRLVTNAIVAAISIEMQKTGKFVLTSFGTFTVKRTKPRLAMNPKTGERIRVNAKNRISFKASPKLKKLLESNHRYK